MTGNSRPRLLVFIVAYNAEKTIQQTLRRIPARLLHDYDVEVLVIDDSSTDQTFDRGESAPRRGAAIHADGAFQSRKSGLRRQSEDRFSLRDPERGFDFVALIHGDGQYAPECLPELIEPLAIRAGRRRLRVADDRQRATRGVAGCRSTSSSATGFSRRVQNRLLRASLSEWHSGYRLYSTAALRRIPFHLNSNVFHFDTEIIIQLLCRPDCAIARNPDSDLLRRRNLARERIRVREGRCDGVSQGPGAGVVDFLRSQVRLPPGRARRSPVRAEVRFREHAHAGARSDSSREPGCSTSDAPAATWVTRCARAAATRPGSTRCRSTSDSRSTHSTCHDLNRASVSAGL